MSVKDLFICSIRELHRHKGRTLACMAGYALAAASLITFCGLWLNAKRSADGVLASTGTHFIAFAPERPEDCDGASGCCFPGSTIEGFWFNGVPTRLLTPELLKKVSELPTVRDASPCLLLRMMNFEESRPYFVAGLDVANPVVVKSTSCSATDITDGKFLQPGERGKAVLEEAYADARGLKTGAIIQIGDAAFTVAGIANTGVRPAKADIYVTIQDAQDVAYSRMYNPPSDIYNLLLVEAKDSITHEQSMTDVKALLSGGSISSYNCFRPAAQVMGINKNAGTILLIVIGVSTLLLALKSQWASMIERRRDIAILKTVGWSSSAILTMLLAESIFQALIGSQLGVLAGLLFLHTSSAPHFTGWNGILPAVWGAATALILLGGALAGIIPALYAARQWPAEGFRTL